MSYNLRFIFQPYPVRNILVSLSGILLVWLSVYLVKNKLSIDFDDQYMHIKRGKHSVTLPLSHVTTIKLTMTTLTMQHYWKLKYIDLDGKKFAVRFMPVYDGSFEQFVDCVKKQNPQVIFQPHSNSLDFDQ